MNDSTPATAASRRAEGKPSPADNPPAVERLATGFRWTEGPVWFGDSRYLLVSDIPNNRIVKWEEETGLAAELGCPVLASPPLLMRTLKSQVEQLGAA